MLSEQERRELTEMARSAPIREEFRRLREASSEAAQHVTLDAYIQFLTLMGRLSSLPARRTPPVSYSNARL